jgi:hypothetical protein
MQNDPCRPSDGRALKINQLCMKSTWENASIPKLREAKVRKFWLTPKNVRDCDQCEKCGGLNGLEPL